MKFVRILETALATGALLAVVGCNTIHGMGKDVSHGGQTIEKSATTVQEQMHKH